MSFLDIQSAQKLLNSGGMLYNVAKAKGEKPPPTLRDSRDSEVSFDCSDSEFQCCNQIHAPVSKDMQSAELGGFQVLRENEEWV